MTRLLLLAPLCVALALGGRRLAAQDNDGAFPAHRVVGNVYYVGSRNLASFLITTNRGHILINSGFAQTVPLIQASIKTLGFRLKDVKILLSSHAHSDHVAGTALLESLTGAQVLVMEGDADIVRSGGEGDFQYQDLWQPARVDRILHDGDRVERGGMVLVAHRTAGHTKGCTTWTFRAEEAGRSYDVVVIGGLAPNPGYRLVANLKYPSISDDFSRTYATLRSLPCDIFLGPHGSYYGMAEKYARLQRDPSTNPFVDPDGYVQRVLAAERRFLDELAKQKSAQP
jgi:metallo-beta-lactamase class B